MYTAFRMDSFLLNSEAGCNTKAASPGLNAARYGPVAEGICRPPSAANACQWCVCVCAVRASWLAVLGLLAEQCQTVSGASLVEHLGSGFETCQYFIHYYYSQIPSA